MLLKTRSIHFARKIYDFLLTLVENSSQNQTLLFKHMHVFMGHFSTFDKSLELAIAIIKDNYIIL